MLRWMDTQMTERVKKAMEYQRLAVRAMLPDPVAEHLAVIGSELQKMAAEMAAERRKRCTGKTDDAKAAATAGGRVNKVEIE